MNTQDRRWGNLFAPALGVLALGLGSPAVRAGSNDYLQTNLVSDIPGVAEFTDPGLVNPWGIVASGTSPFWISDNNSGLSTLYTGTGSKVALTVTIPPPTGQVGPAAPTGIVFNSTSGFDGAHFIFDTEDGTLSSWASGSSAILRVDNSSSGAVYKGLTIANNGSGTFLYATNFNAGTVDVFNSSFTQTTLSGSFTDPSLPAGYAPFNIEKIGSDLYVTYALQDAAKHDDVAGLGNGFIDEYDLNGNLIKRVASNGPLDSPWGMAIAPTGFGPFGGDLLVGNFGDGMIDAYDLSTDTLAGTLDYQNGNPVTIQGLWGLDFGNGASSGSVNNLYFTAGIPGSGMIEDHGLFGNLVNVPDSGSTQIMLAVVVLGFIGLRSRRGRAIAMAVA